MSKLDELKSKLASMKATRSRLTFGDSDAAKQCESKMVIEMFDLAMEIEALTKQDQPI